MSQAQGDIQERIAAARREAESLKEKIRAKKESSADTSRMYPVLQVQSMETYRITRSFLSASHGS